MKWRPAIIAIRKDLEHKSPERRKFAREKLQAIVEQSRARSAVYDVLTNGVPVDLSIATR